jgi:hypothetical protein
MPLVTAGRNFIANAIINEGPPTFFEEANAYLGVGDSTTIFNQAQTDLQAATNKLRKAMEVGYPTIATNVLTFRSLFSTAQANFDWEEWATFNASVAGTMLQRKVESLGTKAGTQSWQLTVDITVVNGDEV